MNRSGWLFGLQYIAFILLSVLFVGCGGGGGGAAPAPAPKPKLSGTVASGGALVNATITLKDSLGTSVTATTDGNGNYSIDTTGLTPPFLLLATKSSNSFYSVSADANTLSTVNITPLTDLIIRTWYQVQGGTVETAFTDPTLAGNEPPTPTVVAVISSIVKNVVQLWLNAAGVSTDNLNLISTPFSANGLGLDKVLDQTTVNPATGQILITSGTVTQDTLLSAGTGSMTVVTSTTGTGSDTSSSTNGTVVPVATAEQSALDGITAAINNFAAAVNLKSSGTLAASDIRPFLDPNGLWGGLNLDQTAKQIAYFFDGTSIAFSDISIKALPSATSAEAVFKLAQSVGSQTNTEPIDFFFTKPSTTWFMSGDNQIAEVEVRALMVKNMGSGASGGTNLSLEVNVNAPRSVPTTTSLTSAIISGGPWSANTLSYNGQNVASWDGTTLTDSYSIYTFNPTGIKGGDLFTISLTPTGGPTVTYTKVLNAITTEPITIVSGLTGTTIATANLGSPQTVTWTLPKTFPISMVRLGTVAQTGPPNDPLTVKCDDSGSQNVLGITATSATVTIPATCPKIGGAATLAAEIYLQVFGINGELTSVYYTYSY